MKLLTTAPSRNDLYGLRDRLRSRGIPTHLQNEQSAISPDIKQQPGLFVILDSQYSDAVALMKNRKHPVAHPLSESELSALEAASKKMGAEVQSNLAKMGLVLGF